MFDEFFKKLRGWCEQRDNLLAILLVGSHARGTARPDSDIDLILIAKEPRIYLESPEWTEYFGPTKQAVLEDWGLVKSWRVIYETGLEIEFGITDTKWCAQEEISGSTGKIITDGVQIICDPEGMMADIILSLSENGR